MRIVKTNFKDLYIIEPIIHKDNRGWFIESYSKNILAKYDIKYDFIQDNHSKTIEKGTIRGLHIQKKPYAQTKLVRCTKGSILDVVVDLRKKSSTFMKWFSIILDEHNKRQLLVPKGFAHGFLTLKDNTEVQYKVDEVYSKENEIEIIYNDLDLNIEWNIKDPKLSDKDANGISVIKALEIIKEI